MKEQNLYVGQAPDHDMIIRCVQEVCEDDVVKRLMEIGEWEFSIKQNAVTRWHCAYICCSYAVWKKVITSNDVTELMEKLEDIVDRERGFVREEFTTETGEDAAATECDGPSDDR